MLHIGAMELVDASTAENYLRRTGRIALESRVTIERLSGGVSNEVLLVTVEHPDQPPRQFVLKQARPQLRTPQPWFCTVERIGREIAVLAICQRLAEPGRTPLLLFEDRENYLFAMTAAPRDHRTWKQDLLSGRADAEVARSCGTLLGRLHAGSWRDPEIAGQLDDCRVFDDLRLDPYYRTVARCVPEAADAMRRAIDSWAAHRCALVHADFSPKNMLLFPGGLMLVDYETGHYGDPAFDLGFFLSHLVLKAAYHVPHHEAMFDLAEQFWHAYRQTVEPRIPAADWRELSARWPLHLGACLWARIDGKSQAEYLTDPARREWVRSIARALLFEPADGWTPTIGRVQAALDEAPTT